MVQVAKAEVAVLREALVQCAAAQPGDAMQLSDHGDEDHGDEEGNEESEDDGDGDEDAMEESEDEEDKDVDKEEGRWQKKSRDRAMTRHRGIASWLATLDPPLPTRRLRAYVTALGSRLGPWRTVVIRLPSAGDSTGRRGGQAGWAGGQ